ncbi:MAG: TonB-dependent receptor, partial [Undibacterium sp.]|nr:TonB-dependent receptor [Opitutaceae bacterium]
SPAPSAKTEPPGEAIKMLEFLVSDKGVSRATNSITPSDVKASLPGMSVERLLALVPGVNIRSTDPFGFYEFGNDIRVRSFGLAALAVTIDDIPLGNNSPRFGTPAGRIVDGENLASITVSQGTGDVTSPAYEALGGAIKYYTVNPSKKMGAQLNLTNGSFGSKRYFGKFETGEITPGLTAFVSTSNLEFYSAGIPAKSSASKVEGKIRYELPKANFSFAYTWNDRDDYDTRSVQWDRWRALETGDPYAGYGPASAGTIYGATEQTNLTLFAKNGYADYLPPNNAALAAAAGLPAGTALAAALVGNYKENGRKFGAIDYLGTAENLGDGSYNQYYKYYRNGRMDSLFRGAADFTVTDDFMVKASSYYQDRHNYGTFPVLRADARTQIVNSYLPANNPNGILRTDIYPRFAYQLNGNLVPIGTVGATPVGYNDTNNNGFLDVGETLNPAATPAAFSNAHALIAPSSTTLANAKPGIPGAIGRDEDFGGQRVGVNLKGILTLGINKITVGGWYENDQQQAFRPTYNLAGGSPQGGFLYDQTLFNNYARNWATDAKLLYIEDVLKFFDDKLSVSLAAKSLTVDKKANGILYTQLYWKPLGQQRITRSVTYKDNFLPQLGLGYKLTPQIELFANYAENFAAPNNDIIVNVDFNESLQPETATNYDGGLRYSGQTFGASFAVFYNQYANRILSVAFTTEELLARGLGGVTGVTQYRNVGGIDSSGAEISADWRTPIKGLRANGSFAYQKSEFSGDLLTTYAAFHTSTTDPRAKFYRPIPNPNYLPGSTDPTKAQYVSSYELQKGKTQGNTPEFTLKGDLNYTWKNVDLSFGGEYYDSVFVNVLNTEKIPSWMNYNAGITVHGPKGSKMENLSASLLVQNLFDTVIWRANGYTGSFNGSVTPDYGRNIVFTLNAKF